MLNVDVISVVLFFQVKVVRETMNRALDTWKEVTDVSEGVPAPVKSSCASVGKVHFFLVFSSEVTFQIVVFLVHKVLIHLRFDLVK